MTLLQTFFGHPDTKPLKKIISAREALESNDWLGSIVGAPTFKPMRCLAIAAMGEPLALDEIDLFNTLTGGRSGGPSKPVRELWLLCGRRTP